VSTQPAAAPLRWRLVVGNLLVLLTALAVTWLVATFAGPSLFRDHVNDSGQIPLAILDRAEHAFHVANLLQVLLASAIAIVLSIAAGWLLTRSLSRSVAQMAAAAASIAKGDYAARLPLSQPSREFQTLAAAFNDMAATVQRTEATRRRMLRDLAHELRTPIATVDGYLEAIDDGVEVPDAATIALLRAQMSRLTRLADDIGDVSMADEHSLRVERRPVRVMDLVDEAVRASRPAYLDKGVGLRLAAPVEGWIDADAVRLGQVLSNVLNNALRHTPAGGDVVVSADTTANRVQISVTDTGEGVPSEHLPFVFERFYRAQPASGQHNQGSGVGLTICRAIVATHSGTVGLESAGPGRGATVRITLPRSPDPR
jgi:signal transduction histidine kinase